MSYPSRNSCFFLCLLLAPTVVFAKIRGVPGVDYPNYSAIPKTSFKCSDQISVPGIYADIETKCQVFHHCYEHRQESFLCIAGTIFNQAIQSCDYWYSSECDTSLISFRDSSRRLKKNKFKYVSFVPVVAHPNNIFEKMVALYEPPEKNIFIEEEKAENSNNLQDLTDRSDKSYDIDPLNADPMVYEVEFLNNLKDGGQMHEHNPNLVEYNLIIDGSNDIPAKISETIRISDEVNFKNIGSPTEPQNDGNLVLDISSEEDKILQRKSSEVLIESVSTDHPGQSNDKYFSDIANSSVLLTKRQLQTSDVAKKRKLRRKPTYVVLQHQDIDVMPVKSTEYGMENNGIYSNVYEDKANEYPEVPTLDISVSEIVNLTPNKSKRDRRTLVSITKSNKVRPLLPEGPDSLSVKVADEEGTEKNKISQNTQEDKTNNYNFAYSEVPELGKLRYDNIVKLPPIKLKLNRNTRPISISESADIGDSQQQELEDLSTKITEHEEENKINQTVISNETKDFIFSNSEAPVLDISGTEVSSVTLESNKTKLNRKKLIAPIIVSSGIEEPKLIKSDEGLIMSENIMSPSLDTNQYLIPPESEEKTFVTTVAAIDEVRDFFTVASESTPETTTANTEYELMEKVFVTESLFDQKLNKDNTFSNFPNINGVDSANLMKLSDIYETEPSNIFDKDLENGPYYLHHSIDMHSNLENSGGLRRDELPVQKNLNSYDMDTHLLNEESHNFYTDEIVSGGITGEYETGKKYDASGNVYPAFHTNEFIYESPNKDKTQDNYFIVTTLSPILGTVESDISEQDEERILFLNPDSFEKEHTSHKKSDVRLDFEEHSTEYYDKDGDGLLEKTYIPKTVQNIVNYENNHFNDALPVRFRNQEANDLVDNHYGENSLTEEVMQLKELESSTLEYEDNILPQTNYKEINSAYPVSYDNNFVYLSSTEDKTSEDYFVVNTLSPIEIDNEPSGLSDTFSEEHRENTFLNLDSFEKELASEYVNSENSNNNIHLESQEYSENYTDENEDEYAESSYTSEAKHIFGYEVELSSQAPVEDFTYQESSNLPDNDIGNSFKREDMSFAKVRNPMSDNKEKNVLLNKMEDSFQSDTAPVFKEELQNIEQLYIPNSPFSHVLQAETLEYGDSTNILAEPNTMDVVDAKLYNDTIELDNSGYSNDKESDESKTLNELKQSQDKKSEIGDSSSIYEKVNHREEKPINFVFYSMPDSMPINVNERDLFEQNLQSNANIDAVRDAIPPSFSDDVLQTGKLETHDTTPTFADSNVANNLESKPYKNMPRLEMFRYFNNKESAELNDLNDLKLNRGEKHGTKAILGGFQDVYQQEKPIDSVFHTSSMPLPTNVFERDLYKQNLIQDKVIGQNTNKNKIFPATFYRELNETIGTIKHGKVAAKGSSSSQFRSLESPFPLGEVHPERGVSSNYREPSILSLFDSFGAAQSLPEYIPESLSRLKKASSRMGKMAKPVKLKKLFSFGKQLLAFKRAKLNDFKLLLDSFVQDT